MKNWKSNLFVILLVIFVLVCGFVLGRIEFDGGLKDGVEYATGNGNIITNDNKGDTNEISSDDFFALFVGKYSYEKVYEEPAGCKDYHDLELKLDGTYIYSYGATCAGGWTLRGNYSIGKDKIYLFNDNCKFTVINNECIEPNCSSLEELDYTLIDGKVKISSGVELIKED